MIVPMKKISLVVMDQYREESLEKLRELGVVHLQTGNASSDKLAGLLERRAKIQSAKAVLKKYIDDKKTLPRDEVSSSPVNDAFYSTDSINKDDTDLVKEVLDLDGELKTHQEEINADSREMGRLEKWGDFNPEDLAYLAEHGTTLTLYELPIKTYNALPKEISVLVIARLKAAVLCAAINASIPGEIPVVLPAESIGGFNKKIAEHRDDIAGIERHLRRLSLSVPKIDAEFEKLNADIEFETAKVNMQVLEDAPSSLTISWIHGFVPEDLAGVVKRGAAENGWALMIDEPSEDDNPPTLTKNSKFARLIQPLFNLLGTIPGYREYDISLSYLIFFSVFFAMIFGDAGYGSIMLIAGIILAIRSKKKTGKVGDAFILLLLLSSCTLIWGAITGAWFGIPINYLPEFMQKLIIPPFFPNPLLSEKEATDLVQQNVKFLCFIIAIMQMGLAHIKNIIREFPKLTMFSQLGWLCMLVGLYFVVLFLILGPEFAIPQFAIYMIGGGLAAFFIFENQTGGNFFKNILKSFANFLTTFLNAISSFSDIISYIRLFAVGLAGASIASSFNNMAMGLPSGPAKIIGGVVILLVGHGLNLAMNALSVIVHGVRLNLLEYAGHLGMEWSGHKYSPFAVKSKEVAK
jgi:V/A-type H+-transporting ATPase subunit I